MTDTRANEIALHWLAEMQRCVRAHDYARAREIFSSDVVAFGSLATMLIGLDDLERDQWQHVWPVIKGFTFTTFELVAGLSGEVVWIACPWTSEGQGSDGVWRSRPGRMTAVLKQFEGRWLAIHTHHSLAPAGSSTSSK
jgi:ketosteroid isomerase-like protein